MRIDLDTGLGFPEVDGGLPPAECEAYCGNVPVIWCIENTQGVPATAIGCSYACMK